MLLSPETTAKDRVTANARRRVTSTTTDDAASATTVDAIVTTVDAANVTTRVGASHAAIVIETANASTVGVTRDTSCDVTSVRRSPMVAVCKFSR